MESAHAKAQAEAKFHAQRERAFLLALLGKARFNLHPRNARGASDASDTSGCGVALEFVDSMNFLLSCVGVAQVLHAWRRVSLVLRFNKLFRRVKRDGFLLWQSESRLLCLRTWFSHWAKVSAYVSKRESLKITTNSALCSLVEAK